MADVLIVCVREDEPKAKALAEMFEAAGFSIGGAPSNDAALRSSGAGLVVWSQASIRSRPFLDAAQRVINARKAVVASLIEPPPPSSIGDSAVFDLSHWDGDPDDPQLDPLFFAVDRMVNAARTSAGGMTDTDERYTPAPRPHRPPPAPQPASSHTRTSSPAGDPLGAEAEHWRAIRDSRDPTDFMDYLARYGPSGAFAEVAELRLKQLTARAEPKPAPAPPRAAPQSPPRATERIEVAPARRADMPPPSPRRADPAPTRRIDPPRYERSYERADLRDPPRDGGGALRTFILIALLGGAALAGGLYFGGGMPNFEAAPSATEDVAGTAPPPAFGEDVSGEPGAEEIAGIPLANAAAPALPRRTEIAARTEPATRQPTAPAREEASEPTTPAPVTSWNDAPGGPVSLRAGETSTLPANAAAATSNLNSPSQQPASTQLASTAPPTRTATPPPSRGSVTWAQRPSARRISELYPSRALRSGVGGRVELNCSVRSNQTLACNVANESPAGMGFGQAALSAAQSYRANPTLSDGRDATGVDARIVVQFQAPPE